MGIENLTPGSAVMCKTSDNVWALHGLIVHEDKTNRKHIMHIIPASQIMEWIGVVIGKIRKKTLIILITKVRVEV